LFYQGEYGYQGIDYSTSGSAIFNVPEPAGCSILIVFVAMGLATLRKRLQVD
jgi:hypothetical protein